MLIVRPKRWTEKPPVGAQLDWSHPLARDMRGCFLLNEGSGDGRVRNLASTHVYAKTGSPAWVNTQFGPALDSSTGNDAGVFDTAESLIRPADRLTLIWRAFFTSITPSANAHCAGVAHNASNSSPFISFDFATNPLGLGLRSYFSDSGGLHNVDHTTPLFGLGANTIHQWAFLFEKTTIESAGHITYRDNLINEGSGSTSNGDIAYGTDAQLEIGCRAGGGQNSSAVSVFVGIWARRLTPGEIMWLWQEPFAFVLPSIRRRYFVPSGAGGPQTLDGSAADTLDQSEIYTTGTISNANLQTLTGTTRLEQREFFAPGLIAGPIKGTIRLDQRTFFATGIIAGPIGTEAGARFEQRQIFAGGHALPLQYLLSGASPIDQRTFFTSGAKVVLIQYLTPSSTLSQQEIFSDGSAIAGIRGYLAFGPNQLFFSGGAVLNAKPITLYISGRDVTRYLHRDGTNLNVSSDIRGRATATITLFNRAGERFRARPGQEIIVWEGIERRFAGFIDSQQEDPVEFIGSPKQAGRLPYWQKLTCISYADILDRRVVTRTFAGPTLQLIPIVQTIVDDFLDDEGLLYAADEDETLENQGPLKFQGETVAEALARIAQVFGFDWWVDFRRVIHFNRNFVALAPVAVREDNDSQDGVNLTRRRRQKRNRQGVIGGAPGSGQRSRTFPALTGAQWDFDLHEQVSGAPTVTLNDTAKIVCTVAQQTTQDWDYSYEVGSPILHANRAKAGPAGDLAVIYPSSDSLDVTFYESASDIARTQAREGGSGRYEAVRRVRNSRSAAAQTATAQRLVEQLGAFELQLEIASHTTGWEVGQLATVALRNPRVQGTFLITSLSYSLQDGTIWRYTITASSVEPPQITGVMVDPNGDILITPDGPIDFDPGGGITITDFGPLDGDGTGSDGSLLIHARFDIREIFFADDGLTMYIVTKEPHNIVETMLFGVSGVDSPYHMVNQRSYLGGAETGTLIIAGHGDGTGTDMIVVEQPNVPSTTPGFNGNPAQTFVVSGEVNRESVFIDHLSKPGVDLIVSTDTAHFLSEGDKFQIYGVSDPFLKLNARFYIAGAGTGGTDIYIPEAQVPDPLPDVGDFLKSGFVDNDNFNRDLFGGDGTGLGGGGGDTEFQPSIVSIAFDDDGNLSLLCDGPHGLFEGCEFQARDVRPPFHPLNRSSFIAGPGTANAVAVIPVAQVPPYTPTDVSLFVSRVGWITPIDPKIIALSHIGPDLVVETARFHRVYPGNVVRFIGILPPYDMLNRGFTAGPLTADTFVFVSEDDTPGNTPGFHGNTGETFVVSGRVHNASSQEDPFGPSDGGGYRGDDPFGGGVFTGLSPTSGNGDPLSGGDDGLIVIALTDIDGARRPTIRTNRPHGLSDSFEVAVVGAQGGVGGVGVNQNEIHGINTERSRITVVSSDEVKLLDNYFAPHASNFVPDGRGRLYRKNAVPRPWSGGHDDTNFQNWFQGVDMPDNSDLADKATFVLAATIPGFASQPLVVVARAANDWTQMSDEDRVVVSVAGFFATPPEGGPIIINVTKNGTSIFGDPDTRLVIPDGATEITRVVSGFAPGLVIGPGDQLNIDVEQVGTDFAGCNGTVVVGMR